MLLFGVSVQGHPEIVSESGILNIGVACSKWEIKELLARFLLLATIILG